MPVCQQAGSIRLIPDGIRLDAGLATIAIPDPYFIDQSPEIAIVSDDQLPRALKVGTGSILGDQRPIPVDTSEVGIRIIGARPVMPIRIRVGRCV